MTRALPLALLLLLIGPFIGPYWSGVALLTWAAVGTGLRACLNLKQDLQDRRSRIRRAIEAQDLERAIGAAELVRPGLLPFPRGAARDPAQPKDETDH
jgi:hypothetical protein